MQAPSDAFLAAKIGAYALSIEHFTWSPQQQRSVEFRRQINERGDMSLTLNGEGLAQGVYLEIAFDEPDTSFNFGVEVMTGFTPGSIEVGGGPIYELFEFPEGIGTLAEGELCRIELRGDVIRWRMGDNPARTVPAPTIPQSFWDPQWGASPEPVSLPYWERGLMVLGHSIANKLRSLDIYFLTGGDAPPAKPFWTDGRGCNYVIQAGVNR